MTSPLAAIPCSCRAIYKANKRRDPECLSCNEVYQHLQARMRALADEFKEMMKEVQSTGDIADAISEQVKK